MFFAGRGKILKRALFGRKALYTNFKRRFVKFIEDQKVNKYLHVRPLCFFSEQKIFRIYSKMWNVPAANKDLFNRDYVIVEASQTQFFYPENFKSNYPLVSRILPPRSAICQTQFVLI